MKEHPKLYNTVYFSYILKLFFEVYRAIPVTKCESRQDIPTKCQASTGLLYLDGFPIRNYRASRSEILLEVLPTFPPCQLVNSLLYFDVAVLCT